MDQIADTDPIQTGFGNEFATEAFPSALLQGRNSPQRPAHGLYAEQLSGTPFTVPRTEARRSWLYRIRPSANHPPYRRIDPGHLAGQLAPPALESPAAPPKRQPTSSPASPPCSLPPTVRATTAPKKLLPPERVNAAAGP